jgi:hypothetical protein
MRTRLLPTCVLAQTLLLGACHSNDVTGTVSSPGDAGADPWACLDEPPQVTDTSAVAITFKMYDVINPITTAGSMGGSDFTVLSFVPLPGIAIQGCSSLDPTCSSPTAPPETSNDAGEATLSVPDNFNGFFELTAAGYLPFDLFPGPLLADASTFAPPVSMITPVAAISLADAIGAAPDLDAGAGVGAVFVAIYDCSDRYAAGVTFSIPGTTAATVPFYITSGLPSAKATETDSSGTWGAVDVPVGALTVTATLAATSRPLGSINVMIRAGGAATAWIRARTHS